MLKFLGDGTAWIWNMAADRFSDAKQNMDFFHPNQHLWSVTKALFPDNSQEAKQWMHQQQKALNKDQTFKLLKTLRELEKGMSGTIEEAVGKEANYLKNHQIRLGYADTDKKGEPIGSGSIESCCRHITYVNSKGLVNFRFRKETKHYWFLRIV